MSLVRLWYELLGLSEDVSTEELKRAYRRLVKRHHPDRFQGEERALQQLRMAEINDAYRNILRSRAGLKQAPPAASPAAFRRGPLSASREVGLHGDPAYAYYKQGFVHYSRGAGGMMMRGPRRKLNPDSGGLEQARTALRFFLQAHGYFRRVVEEFPESPWAADAEWRLERIEGFTRIYRKISRNIEKRLAEAPVAGVVGHDAPEPGAAPAPADADDALDMREDGWPYM